MYCGSVSRRSQTNGHHNINKMTLSYNARQILNVIGNPTSHNHNVTNSTPTSGKQQYCKGAMEYATTMVQFVKYIYNKSLVN